MNGRMHGLNALERVGHPSGGTMSHLCFSAAMQNSQTQASGERGVMDKYLPFEQGIVRSNLDTPFWICFFFFSLYIQF